MELTRAAPICIRFVESALQVAESWDMSERLRSFAVVVSKKHKDWKKCKYCLAIKIDIRLSPVVHLSHYLLLLTHSQLQVTPSQFLIIL